MRDAGDQVIKHLRDRLQHAHKLKQQQLEKETLTNHLEASYYQLKNKLTEDQQWISRLSERTRNHHLTLIQERLDGLYHDRTDLEGLKAYQRELDHFYHILQGKMDYDKKQSEITKNFTEKYQTYTEWLQHLGRKPLSPPARLLLHQFSQQLTRDWRWFKQHLESELDPEVMSQKINNLNKLARNLELILDPRPRNPN